MFDQVGINTININVINLNNCGFSTKVPYCEVLLQKMLNIKNVEKPQYLPLNWSDKGFKGTVVNETLPSLQGVSLEIRLQFI